MSLWETDESGVLPWRKIIAPPAPAMPFPPSGRRPGTWRKTIAACLVVATCSAAVGYQWGGSQASRLSQVERRDAMKTAEGAALEALARDEYRHIRDGLAVLAAAAEREPAVRDHVRKILPHLQQAVGHLEGGD